MDECGAWADLEEEEGAKGVLAAAVVAQALKSRKRACVASSVSEPFIPIIHTYIHIPNETCTQ